MKQTSYFEKNQQLLNPSPNYLKGGKRRYKSPRRYKQENPENRKNKL